MSAQLDSIYVDHDEFNYKLFLGHFAEQDKESNFYDEVRTFLTNRSDLTQRSVNLRTVSEIARWHKHMRDMESSKSWKMPTMTDVLYNGATAIVAILVFALSVYLLFRLVGCFWQSTTGKSLRALRGQDVYNCGTCGALNSDAESTSDFLGTFRHRINRIRGHSPTAPPAELVHLATRSNVPASQICSSREYRESRRGTVEQPPQPAGRGNRQRDHRRARPSAVPRHHNNPADVGIPVRIADQIDAIRRLYPTEDSGELPHPLSMSSTDEAMPLRGPTALPRYSQAIAQRYEADGSNPTNTTDEIGLEYEPAAIESALEAELRGMRVTRHD